MHVQVTVPADEETDVPIDQSIRVQFDRFLGPVSAIRQSICVSAVGTPSYAEGKCPAESVFTQPDYDPVDRVAVFRTTTSGSIPTLLPNTRYVVTIAAPTGPDDAFGVRAFDGAPLHESVRFAFTTGPLGTKGREPARAVDYCYRPTSLCAAADSCRRSPVPATTPGPAAILGGCAESGRCHASSSSAATPVPGVETPPFGSALALDGDGVRRAIGAVATLTATGADPRAPNRGGARFGVDMPYVDPGVPANSFLLYKLVLGLADDMVEVTRARFAAPTWSSCDLAPPGEAPDDAGACVPIDLDAGGAPAHLAGDEVPAPVEPWIDPSKLSPPADGELARLRRVLSGRGMPLAGTTDVARVRTVSAWISAGATWRDCGTP